MVASSLGYCAHMISSVRLNYFRSLCTCGFLIALLVSPCTLHRQSNIRIINHLAGLSIFVANLVLEDTYERLYHADSFGDIPRGVFLIRGENVVLLGEIVSSRPVPPLSHLGHLPVICIFDLCACMPNSRSHLPLRLVWLHSNPIGVLGS